MISLIEALNYRCLRYVRQKLGPFHVLVGPNASGKTTFLDVVSFLSRLASHGLDAAISDRTNRMVMVGGAHPTAVVAHSNGTASPSISSQQRQRVTTSQSHDRWSRGVTRRRWQERGPLDRRLEAVEIGLPHGC